MNKIVSLLLLLCFAQFAFSQKKISEKFIRNIVDNMKEIWEESDPYFSAKGTTSFENSSAVILAQRSDYVFDRRPIGLNKGIFIIEKTRRKIKLQDQNAVKRFSEIHFKVSYNDGKYGVNHINSGFAARVYKKNGTKQELDLANALEVAEWKDVPEYYHTGIDELGRSGNIHSTNLYKIAVPDLQVGDVIEYGYIDFIGMIIMRGVHQLEFSPQYYLCNREYPVAQQKILFTADQDFYVNIKTINGAPKVFDKGDKPQVYEWNDVNRSVAPDKSWINTVSTMPLLKFQVIYSSSENAKNVIIGTKGELNESISPKQITDVARSVSKEDFADVVADRVEGDLKEISADKLSNEDYINVAYFMYRKSFSLGTKWIPDSRFFANEMWKLCKKRNIPCEIVVTADNFLSTVQDLLFKGELEWGVKINGKYLFCPGPHSLPFATKLNCEGNETYVLPADQNGTHQKVTLPVSIPDANNTRTVINCSVDETLDNVIVQKNVSVKGISRELVSSDILANTYTLQNDYKIYNSPNPRTRNYGRAAMRQFEKDAINEEAEEKKNKPDQMKKLLEESELGQVISYDDFKLVSDGRTPNAPVLTYEEKYKLGGLGSRAGKNILISIPKLIGKQTHVDTEDRDNAYDIDIYYTRSYSWTLKFTIPAGYKVDGLAALNSKVDNETGAFIANAKVEGNLLTIDITKTYKQKKIKFENWPKALAFLDAAYDFSQKKIVLRK